MSGFCVSGDHASCPDAVNDEEVCSCPCHIIGDAVDSVFDN